jgi:hypothetical protein
MLSLLEPAGNIRQLFISTGRERADAYAKDISIKNGKSRSVQRWEKEALQIIKGRRS